MTAQCTETGQVGRTSRTEIGGERGMAISIEAVIIIPAIMVLIFLVVGWTRYALAQTAVEAAAGSAARAAALARTAPQAVGDARDVANANLASAGLRCAETKVTTDVAGFAVKVGNPASVGVTVSCTLRTSDLAIGMGRVAVTKSGTAPLDRYRGRE